MISVSDLTKQYVLSAGWLSRAKGKSSPVLRAVDGVDFSVAAGQVMGLVGESGCGKSTLARLLVGLDTPSGGDVLFDGESARALQQKDRKAFHRRVQMVFQDPYGSLNPQQQVRDIVSRPLVYQRAGLSASQIETNAINALQEAGLSPSSRYLDKYPHQLSGGQRQRVCIARAIVMQPQLLVADEPISMLDVSIKWEIIQLLKRLVRERQLAMVYITHDLSTVGSICDTLAIMYLGRIVETGPTAEIIANPQHPYTKALLASTPSIDPDHRRLPANILGSIPNPSNIPSGCRFHPRCPVAQPVCSQVAPAITASGSHMAACHFGFGANTTLQECDP